MVQVSALRSERLSSWKVNGPHVLTPDHWVSCCPAYFLWWSDSTWLHEATVDGLLAPPASGWDAWYKGRLLWLMALWTMTRCYAISFAFKTEMIISLLAPGPSRNRVILLNGKSSWKTFRKYGCFFPGLSPSSIVPWATQDSFFQWTLLLDCAGPDIMVIQRVAG